MLKIIKKKHLSLFSIGTLFGILVWGGFNMAMEKTNSLEFCISCHEMEHTVYQEYKKSVHYKNASGVRATCPDCHVPREWLPKVVRKIKATNELFHKVMGTINTPEKFEVKRLELAENVWRTMRETDSRECRNCHSYESMDFHKQSRRAAEKMQEAIETGSEETCIDCHKGTAHKKPRGDDDEDD
ncbi:MAG: NapC/NirT family cytochrome c [Sedimenticola sp.]